MMLDRLERWILVEAVSREAGRGYLVLMGLAVGLVLGLAAGGLRLAVPIFMATGIVDVLLHAAGRIKARLPVSIPLGVVAALVVAGRAAVVVAG